MKHSKEQIWIQGFWKYDQLWKMQLQWSKNGMFAVCNSKTFFSVVKFLSTDLEKKLLLATPPQSSEYKPKGHRIIGHGEICPLLAVLSAVST